MVLACSKDPVSTPNGAGPTCLAPPDSIVGWWPLDQPGAKAEELVLDNDGDCLGDPSGVVGKVGGALRFDGLDDAISVGDPSANWVYDISGSLTLEAWVIRESNQTGRQIIVGKDRAYWLWFENGVTVGMICCVQTTLGTTPVPVGEWCHVAVTYDQAKKALTVYLNGEIDGVNATDGQNVPVSDHPINIGAWDHPGTNMYYFHGLIDEVSVYNTALSPIEIREINARGTLGKCK
jgi:hypothetical protein